MGLLKKLTKPLSKFLDKIIPNEIKPALPYMAAFAPFMMSPTGIMGSTMMRRALMSGALNLGSQLAQEGSEGEFDPLSLALASGIGALSAPGTPDKLMGVNKFGGTEGMTLKGTPSAAQFFEGKAAGMDPGWMKSGTEMLGTGADYLTKAGTTLRDTPFSKEGLKAALVPATTGTADLARITAQQALRDFENAAEESGDPLGVTDEGRRIAIRRAMEMAGHYEEDILSALAALGLRSGGIVGLKHGGRIGYKERGFVNPDDYPQQEDVSILELQQEEGVPIGPMVKNEFESDMLSALKQAYDEAVKKGYKGSFRQFIQEQGSGIRAAQGGMMSVLPKGKEMDYRGGGVIPVGSRERADDVPARLSKNEFVMTADAVKAAGGGSVNRGAKKMYNLMHNLEARV